MVARLGNYRKEKTKTNKQKGKLEVKVAEMGHRAMTTLWTRAEINLKNRNCTGDECFIVFVSFTPLGHIQCGLNAIHYVLMSLILIKRYKQTMQCKYYAKLIIILTTTNSLPFCLRKSAS